MKKINMENAIVLLVVSLMMACGVESTTISDSVQGATMCVSTPTTHPIAGVSQCPPPDPYTSQEQRTDQSAAEANPGGIVDSSSTSCFFLVSGDLWCSTTVSLGIFGSVGWTCRFNDQSCPNGCCASGYSNE